MGAASGPTPRRRLRLEGWWGGNLDQRSCETSCDLDRGRSCDVKFGPGILLKFLTIKGAATSPLSMAWLSKNLAAFGVKTSYIEGKREQMSCVLGGMSCVLLNFLTKGATLWVEKQFPGRIPLGPGRNAGLLLKFLTNLPQKELQLDIFQSSTALIYYYI